MTMRWAGRGWALSAALVALLTSWSAEAHPPRTTALFLDLGERQVELELQIPLDQLGLALEQPLAEHPTTLVADQGPALRAYVASHLGATAPDGRLFAVEVGAMEVASIDAADALVVHLSLRPPEGASSGVFTLKDDVVLHRVVTHKTLVSVRRDFKNAVFSDKPELLGVLRYQRETMAVDRSQGSWWRGFSSVFWLGTRHIAEGSDHLLFLLVLLLPAPLLARDGRWREAASVKQSVRNILAIVSSFTLGHSLTLVLAATGTVRVPSRPVEVLIALSIMVSAAQALRPILRRREWLVAGGFGLVHGLAFAGVLSDMGFDGRALTVSVLGFNLGIEAMQLAVVAMTLPWLMLLSRTSSYRAVRLVGAALAGIAALFWAVERALEIRNPVGPLVDVAFEHGLAVVGLLAVASVALTLQQRSSSTATNTL